MKERYEILMFKDYARVYDTLVENWYTIDYSFYEIENKQDVIEVIEKYYN